MRENILFSILLILSCTCLYVLVTDYEEFNNNSYLEPATMSVIYGNVTPIVKTYPKEQVTSTLKYAFYNHTTKEVTYKETNIPIYNQ